MQNNKVRGGTEGIEIDRYGEEFTLFIGGKCYILLPKTITIDPNYEFEYKQDSYLQLVSLHQQ
jgi:hypothetical protein